jgi:Fic/DOC family
MTPKFVDPYAYPGTDVLKNKPGIRNEQVLRTFEYEQTARRAQELNRKPIAEKFDLDHLKAIHKHLFRDVYAWAGEVRTVNISKDSLGFAPAPYIESHGRTVAADLAKENYLKGLGKPKFVERLAHHFTEFNVLHPFRIDEACIAAGVRDRAGLGARRRSTRLPAATSSRTCRVSTTFRRYANLPMALTLSAAAARICWLNTRSITCLMAT